MIINRTVHLFEPNRRLFGKPEIYIITFVYIVIGIVGTLGNLLTIYVILRTSKLRKKIITTLFLCNLAVSDLMLIVIGVPSDVMYMWNQWSTWPTGVFWGNFGCLTKGARSVCKRARTYHSIVILIGTASNASILTIAAMAFESFIAVKYPLSVRHHVDEHSSKVRACAHHAHGACSTCGDV
jgi:thyrotropin-releasing hormone receptor